jgi:hypothetical protein
MCKEEDVEMATETYNSQFILNEEDSKRIISTPRGKINETKVFNDLKLNKSDRIANASRILSSRKCK